MTKKLNESAIMSELTGQSAYFRQSTPPPSDVPNEDASRELLPESQNHSVSAPVAAKERLEISSPTQDSTMKSASTLASNQASLLASYHASIIEVIRKTVKDIGKEVMFVRLTLQEKEQLADIAYTYKRQGVKTSENEISRIALNYLLEDYKAHGQESVLAKVIASLLA